jgi:UDP-2,3-diacylglucosamine hydrolase
MWANDYLTSECGMILHKSPVVKIIDGKKFHLAHGEGLGSKDPFYRLLLSIFRNRPLQVLYSALHPSIGVGIGHKWSFNSRLAKGISKEFLGEENEDLIRYSKSVLEKEHIDYFIYGHRHLERKFRIQDTEIIFLGDWIKRGSFCQWDGCTLQLRVKD